MVTKLAKEFLPREVSFIVEVVEVVDSIVKVGCSLWAVEDIRVVGAWDFEDGEHVEGESMLMELAERLLPVVEIVGDCFAGVEVCGKQF